MAPMRTHAFWAMDCDMALWLEADDPASAERALAEAETEVHEAENVLSRFRTTSALTRLNQAAGTPVVVASGDIAMAMVDTKPATRVDTWPSASRSSGRPSRSSASATPGRRLVTSAHRESR